MALCVTQNVEATGKSMSAHGRTNYITALTLNDLYFGLCLVHWHTVTNNSCKMGIVVHSQGLGFNTTTPSVCQIIELVLSSAVA